MQINDEFCILIFYFVLMVFYDYMVSAIYSFLNQKWIPHATLVYWLMHAIIYAFTLKLTKLILN